MLRKLVAGLLKLLPESQRKLERKELSELLEESIRDTITFDNHESTLLKNILGLENISASDVMVPRADIVSADIDDSIETILNTMIDGGHTRMPITKGSLDTVLGFLHIKDVARCLNEDSKLDIPTLLHQPIFISPTMRTLDLLQEMQVQQLHIALVVDEYGGTDGLITIEDLVEEIVGEINDEHDEGETPVFEMNDDGTATMGARLGVGVLEEIAGCLLDDMDGEEKVDTVGGLIVSLAGRVPIRGEIIRHPAGIEFEILESQPRHINLVKISGLSDFNITAVKANTEGNKAE
jgi:CBS domain containing-hemolysin-like protein